MVVGQVPPRKGVMTLDESLREILKQAGIQSGLHRIVSKEFDINTLSTTDTLDEAIAKIKALVVEAKIDMLETFIRYEENQPGYIDWDFLANQISSLRGD